MKKGLSFSVLVIAMIVIVWAVASNFAQKSNDVTSVGEMSSDRAKARHEISKSVSGSLVLDAITVKETDWSLTHGRHPVRLRGDSSRLTALSFQKDSLTLHITLDEFDSIDQAESSFSMGRSHGAAVPFRIGDRGEKVYVQSGRMVGLNFRVGNIKVSIGGTADEKLAERFAGHVLEAIKGLASK